MWKFNPPLAPWMGGAMEFVVKIKKKIVKVNCKRKNVY